MARTVEAQFLSGPWCGTRVVLRDPPDWLWLDGDPRLFNRPPCYRQPAFGRLLYRRLTGEPTAYLFADLLFTVCTSCGVLHARHDECGERVERCDLCGMTLLRAVS